MSRIDSRNLIAGTEMWIQGGTYCRKVRIEMVRNGLVFFSHNIRENGQWVKKWDRLTVEWFIDTAVTGEEHAQYRAQFVDRDNEWHNGTADNEYCAKLRHNRNRMEN